jgi:hypothetical protein
VLDFPTIGHLWKHESFWVSLSVQRSDGWRTGVFMEQLAGLSSTMGLWHKVAVSLSCPSDVQDSASGAARNSNTGCELDVSVDGNKMQPLTDGMRLRNGQRVVLPSEPGYLGLVATDGHG